MTLNESETEIERLKEELEVTKKELHYSSEPQAYLLEALRRREHEVLDLRRQLRTNDAELERSRRQLEHVTSSKIGVEEDLKKVLAQRQHLDGLRAILSGGNGVAEADVGGTKGTDPALRAEHRGRAPSQQPQSQGIRLAWTAIGKVGPAGAAELGSEPQPAWFQRLKRNK